MVQCVGGNFDAMDSQSGHVRRDEVPKLLQTGCWSGKAQRTCGAKHLGTGARRAVTEVDSRSACHKACSSKKRDEYSLELE